MKNIMAVLFEVLPEPTPKCLLLSSKCGGLCAVGLSIARMLCSNVQEGAVPKGGYLKLKLGWLNFCSKLTVGLISIWKMPEFPVGYYFTISRNFQADLET